MNIVLDFTAAVVTEEAQPVKHPPHTEDQATVGPSRITVPSRTQAPGPSHTQATGASHTQATVCEQRDTCVPRKHHADHRDTVLVVLQLPQLRYN